MSPKTILNVDLRYLPTVHIIFSQMLENKNLFEIKA